MSVSGFARAGVVSVCSMLVGACGDGHDAKVGDRADTPPAVTATKDHEGETTYNRYCYSCHAGGIAGAPKFGDVQAWRPRIAKGESLLLQATIEGVDPGMPARGLCSSCSDEELAAAVDYMVTNSQ